MGKGTWKDMVLRGQQVSSVITRTVVLLQAYFLWRNVLKTVNYFVENTA